MAWNTENANSMEGTFKDAVSFNQPLAGGESSGGDPIIEDVNSATLAAATDYITGTKSTALELEGDQTWSIRVKPSDITGVNQLMTLNYDAPNGRATNVRFYLGVLNFLGYPNVGINSFTQYNSSESFVEGQGYHILISMSTTAVTFYINGEKEIFGGFGSVSGNDASLDLAIGTVTGGGVGGNKVNRVQVWNRVLTDLEAAEDYNGSATEYVCNAKQVTDGSTLVNGRILDTDLDDASLVDHTGNSTLSEVGTITYTDQGMTKECGTTPVIPASGGLDTSNATNMDNMLDGATSFDQDLGGFDVTSLLSAVEMCNGITLSTANYDALLAGWAAQTVQQNVVFDGGNSQYSSTGETSRDILTNTYNWTITDGGLEP